MTASTLSVPTTDRYAALLETADDVARQHDPVACKAREVGDWALNRRAPEFSLYR